MRETIVSTLFNRLRSYSDATYFPMFIYAYMIIVLVSDNMNIQYRAVMRGRSCFHNMFCDER